jgi:Tat protein translocase TatB subunit
VFDVSFLELLVIFLVVLVLFGPERLPEFAAKLGKLTGELRKATDSLRREFYNSVYKPADEGKEQIGSVARDLRAIKHEIAQDLRTPPAPPAPQKAPSEEQKK